MSREDTGESGSVPVPGDLRDWLDRAAEERGTSVDEFVRELLRAHRAVDRDNDAVEAPPELVDREELEGAREEFTDLLEDVRSRVIQVKRETDAKAPADHRHEAIEEEIASIEADLDALQSGLSELETGLHDRQEDIDDLEATVEGGFENYETVLEHALSVTDDLTARTDRLARAAVANRERVQELERAVGRREAADRLKRDAAHSGVSTANCEDCGASVEAALLTAPECPYCSATFVDVSEKRRFFGSATFQTGDRPALGAGETADETKDLEADLADERPDPSDVDWDTAGDDR